MTETGQSLQKPFISQYLWQCGFSEYGHRLMLHDIGWILHRICILRILWSNVADLGEKTDLQFREIGFIVLHSAAEANIDN